MSSKTRIFFCVVLFFCLSARWAIAADGYFNLSQTLRVDFVLAGNHSWQKGYLAGLSRYQGWSGSANQLISPFDFGEYRYLLISPETGDTLFRRGFSTLFEEWRTIDEAKEKERAFQQTILMPAPLKPLLLQVDARERDGSFTLLFQENIDPASLSIVVREANNHPYMLIHGSDNPRQRFDLLFVAEGYTAGEQAQFYKDVGRLTNQLFEVEPFRSHKNHITIRALAVPSVQSGTDDPRAGIWRNTAMNSSFNTFGVDRYLETEATWQVFDYAMQLPHDHLVVLVNSNKYGGGGIYNHFSVVTSANRYSGTVLIHELGHGFAGLGDEYFGSDVSYNDYINLETEPWQPNLTTLVNFSQKWQHRLAPGTPVPTPVRPMYKNSTGVFEGGGYVSKGVYRPAINCRMRTSDARDFCEVCTSVIIQKIRFFTH